MTVPLVAGLNAMRSFTGCSDSRERGRAEAGPSKDPRSGPRSHHAAQHCRALFGGLRARRPDRENHRNRDQGLRARVGVKRNNPTEPPRGWAIEPPRHWRRKRKYPPAATARAEPHLRRRLAFGVTSRIAAWGEERRIDGRHEAIRGCWSSDRLQNERCGER